MPDIPEPIIILGSPRSGTSLTAEIFAAHGVWIGTSRERDEWNEHGYFENVMLAEFRHVSNYGAGMDRRVVEDLIVDDGYPGGPWLVKHSPPTWRAWCQFQPKWVLVRRSTEDIIKSRIRCEQWPMSMAEHRIAVDTDDAILDGVNRYLGAPQVRPQEFIDGDWSGMRIAFAHCGLELDVDLARACIDKGLWKQENT